MNRSAVCMFAALAAVAALVGCGGNTATPTTSTVTETVAAPPTSQAPATSAAPPTTPSLDDQFIGWLEDKLGITGSQSQLIKAGHDVCKVLDKGTNSLTALAVTVQLDAPDVITTPDDGAKVATAAIHFYCPSHANDSVAP